MFGDSENGEYAVFTIVIKEVTIMERKARAGDTEVTRAQMLSPEMAFVAIVNSREQQVETDQSWELRALCGNENDSVFFPEKGGSVRAAKKVCAQCGVRGQCLEAAVNEKRKFGVWGGLTEKERRPLYKKQA